jgi:hypothetical protein
MPALLAIILPASRADAPRVDNWARLGFVSMSNQQWPRGGDPRNPWAQQDPNWRPSNFQDHTGRDPRRPFGANHEPQALPDLEPPKKPVWPWVVGVLAVIAALLAFLLWAPGTQEVEPSEQPPASAFPSPTLTGNALPFEGNGTGIFEATAHRWTAAGLEIDYKITVDDGTRRFTFFAFDNATRESFIPNDDRVIEVSPDTPAIGTVTFSMPRGEASFVLTTVTGRAITALPIPG